MPTNSRTADRNIGEDLSGLGSSASYIDIDIGIDMMVPRHDRRSHLKAGKAHAWAGATELQSNLHIEVGDRSFHLHKFPLISKSGRLNRLVFESRDTEKDRILLPDIPGGAEAFELAARFLYGGNVELTPFNVATLRCAAEYLEMTDNLGDGNLVAKTENYLNFVVLGSWKDSISVLKTCSHLKPWAEDLEIMRRCSESVAWKASTDPHGIRWSFSTKAGARDAPRDWWFDDVCSLYIDTFSKVINAVNVKGMNYTMVAAAVIHYAEKWLGLTKGSNASTTKNSKEESQGSFMAFTGFNQDIVAKDAKKAQHKNRAILQGVVSLLPAQQDSISCRFLLKLLRVACMVNAGPLCKTDLARRIGIQLEKVSVDDLLIPAYSSTNDNMYDIDVVQQIVEHYLQEQSSGTSPPVSPTGSLSSSSISGTTSSSSLTGASMTSASSKTSSASSVTTGTSSSDRSVSGSSTSGRSVSDSSSGRSSVSGSSVNGSSVTSSSATGSSGSGSDSSYSSISSVTSDSSRSDRSGSIVSSVTSASSLMSSDESVKLEKKFYVSEGPSRKPQLSATPSNLKVAQLLETYLEEVAKDSSIPLGKFAALAELFSEFPRDSDDCIYRAIDTFLRAHPTLTEHERKRLCRVMDTQALSLNACMHAASNERLPLRVVVQVLFTEQVKLRNAITGSAVINDKDFDSGIPASFSSSTSSLTSSSSDPTGSTSTNTGTGTNSLSSASTHSLSIANVINLSNASPSIASAVSSLLPGGLSVKETLKAAVAEIELLRKAVQEFEAVKSRLSLMDSLQHEMDFMTKKFQDLAHDYVGMTHQVEELTKSTKNKSAWSSGWKKMAKPFGHSKDHHEKPDYHYKDWDLQKDYAHRFSTEQHKVETLPLYQMKTLPPTDIPALPAPKADPKIENALAAVRPKEQPVKEASPLVVVRPKEQPVKEASPLVVVRPKVEPVKEVVPQVQLALKETPKLVAVEAPKDQKKEIQLTDAKAEKDGAAETADQHHKDHRSHKAPDLSRGHHPRSHHRATTPEYHGHRHRKDSDTMSVSSDSSSMSTSSTHSYPHPKDHRHRESSSGHRRHRYTSEDHHHRSSSGHGHRGGSQDKHHAHQHRNDGSEHHREHSSGHGRHRDGSEDRHRRKHLTPEHSGHHHRKDHHSDSHHRQNSKEPHASTTSNHSGHHHKDGSEHHASSHHHSHHGKDQHADSHHRHDSKEPHSASATSNGHHHKDTSEHRGSHHHKEHHKDGPEHHSSHHRHKQHHKDVDTSSNASSESERPRHRRYSVT